MLVIISRGTYVRMNWRMKSVPKSDQYNELLVIKPLVSRMKNTMKTPGTVTIRLKISSRSLDLFSDTM